MPAQIKTSQYDIVALHNIDDEKFVFEYDRSKGNYPHEIPAGEIRRFPRFLAEHALKHLIDKILNKRKERTSNQTLRNALATQIVVDEEIFQKKPVVSEADVRKADLEKMNRPSDLDRVLTKTRDKEKAKEKVDTTQEMDKPAKEEKPKEEFAGLKDEPKEEKKAIKPAKKVEPAKEKVKPMPTRNEIYSYAKNTLNMVIDADEKKKFDKMKVSELLEEIGDPREKIN